MYSKRHFGEGSPMSGVVLKEGENGKLAWQHVSKRKGRFPTNIPFVEEANAKALDAGLAGVFLRPYRYRNREGLMGRVRRNRYREPTSNIPNRMFELIRAFCTPTGFGFERMDYMWLCSVLVHTTTNALGITFNLLLIFLILRKTPKTLRTYSIFIFNFALCDLCACSAALLVQQRIISGGTGLYLIFHGPCKLIGSQACFIMHSFAMHCYSHALWSLLFSFSYRFYILKRAPPSNRSIVVIFSFLYLPSLLQFILFCFANSGEIEVKAILKNKYGYDVHSECVGGTVNVFAWHSLPVILHMTLPVTPVYIAIHVLRKLTISVLDLGNLMSENTRRLHSQLLQALTIQACLPIFFLLAVTAYAIEQLNIYRHPILEYSCFPLVGVIPMLSPLTSFLFVRPYKIWIQRTLLHRPKVSFKSTVSTIASTTAMSEGQHQHL